MDRLNAAMREAIRGEYQVAVAEIRAAYARGDAAAATRDFGRALATEKPTLNSSDLVALLQAVAESEDEQYALYNLGSALWLIDEHSAAIEAFEIAARSGNDAAALALGESRLWMGKPREAIEPLHAVVNRAGEDAARAAGVLARAYMQLPEPDWMPIVDLLRTAAHEDDSFVSDLGRALVEVGQQPEAIRILEASQGDDPDIAVVLGNIYWEAGDLLAARTQYERGVSLGDAHSAYNLAGVLTEAGDLVAAGRWLHWAAQRGDQRAINRLARTSG